MTNYEHFRNGELVNCIYEFSKRVNLPENMEHDQLKNTKWIKHTFVRPLYRRLVDKLPTLNVKLIFIYFFIFFLNS